MADNTNIEPKNEETTQPAENKTEDGKNPTAPTIEELAASVKALQIALDKQKRATDNASSDAAKWKDKYKSTLSEAEKAEAERAEAERALREENELLKRDRVIGAYSTQALSLDGYNAALAAQTAEAMANGDMGTVFAVFGQVLETVKTKAVTDSLAKQPGLSVGVPPSTNTVKEDEDNQYRKWMGLPPIKK